MQVFAKTTLNNEGLLVVCRFMANFYEPISFSLKKQKSTLSILFTLFMFAP